MGSLPVSIDRLIHTALATALCLVATIAHAQDAAPAHIAVVDGTATLDTERGSELAAIGLPLVPGDRLRTTGGRVEIIFPDGSILDVDEYTTVDLRSDTLLRLAEGRVLLIVAGANDPANAHRYQLDTPVASARNEGPGEYRLALLNGIFGLESELAVLRGTASLTTENGSTWVRAGERSLARDNSAPGFPQRFNSARFDAFDQWTDARRDARLGSSSVQYLPRDLQTYGGTFDRSGSWAFESSYGYVWYPAVASTWRPYYHGYWASVRPYGWTWIGFDPWVYPTHHYGRWGYLHSRWFWIPDKRWGPAWVSWAAAPGYVSWCPLGFDNRPVISLVGTASPWSGWVLVPRQHFGIPDRHVQNFAVVSPSLSARTPLVQTGAPSSPARAVPRPSSGTAVSVAVPRSTPAPSERSSATFSSAVTGARAVPRPGARTPDTPANTSPIFKTPMPADQQRSPALSALSPRPATAPAYIPGARPSPSREGPAGVIPQTAPAYAPQAQERTAAPRPGVAMPQRAERPTAVRPSVVMPVARDRQTAPAAAPSAQAASPARAPSASPTPSTSGRAVPRSAQAQPSSGSQQGSDAQSASTGTRPSASTGSPPAGARSRR